MRKQFMTIMLIGLLLMSLVGCNEKTTDVTKTAVDIQCTEVKDGFVNTITLEDGSSIEVKTKHKIVRQEELDQFITVDSKGVKYVKIPSYR